MTTKSDQIDLHAGQRQIFDAVTQDNGMYYIICPSGRQFGKTHVVRLLLPTFGMRDWGGHDGLADLKFSHILYIAPSQKLAKNLMWFPLLELTRYLGVYKKSWENDLILELVNGRKIYLLGADKPDSLRGYSPSFVAVDEAVDIKKAAIMESIWPAMSRLRATFLMIGTPKGKGGVFYEFYKHGLNPDRKMWASFNFPSVMNPMYDPMALEEAKMTLPEYMYDQEYNAVFRDATGQSMNRDMFPIVTKNKVPFGAGRVYIAMDPAGYNDKTENPDNHSIAAVLINGREWFVLEVQAGRWSPREAAIRYVSMVRKYKPVRNGIEASSHKEAMNEPISEIMKSHGLSFKIEAIPVKQGKFDKEEKIRWAIQGRAEAGNIKLVKGDWNEAWLCEAEDFPSRKSHDDMIESVALVDRISKPTFISPQQTVIKYTRRR